MYFRQLFCLLLFVMIALKRTDAGMTFEQMERTAKGFRNKCQGKVGVDVALLDGMKKGEFPEDRKLQCYTQCIMKLVRTMKDGKIDLDMVLKQVDIMMPNDIQGRVKESARSCTSKANSDDECVLAYQFVKCSYETDPEVFFFP